MRGIQALIAPTIMFVESLYENGAMEKQITDYDFFVSYESHVSSVIEKWLYIEPL